MKICSRCGQIVAEEIKTCPACGADVAAGRVAIDDYRILVVLHEGYSTTLCKAQQEGAAEPVMIRIFTPPSGVDAALADRLKNELEELKALPEAYFVRHLAIRKSADGLWYRISEWVDTISWPTLLATGRLKDPRITLGLFHRIASILDGLHRIGHIVPHLNLDDILVYEDAAGELRVKIDYKLSRFLDPRLDRPGPMMARLLALHPDIVNRRPLDHRSDIWSLGKSFVEILSADPGVVNLQARVETLPVPAEIRTLIRLMLNDNPDLRPRTMAEVAAALTGLDDQALKCACEALAAQDTGSTRAMLRRVNLRLGFLAAFLALLIAAGAILWYRLGPPGQDSETALISYANRYAGSVAFLVVDYWLQQGDRRVYSNRSEGTAFLVDTKGWLLTNRHVACPWLEDEQLMMIIGLLSQRPEKLHLDYRIFLWFEGQRAFSRLPALSESGAVDDVYVTETAYRSEGPRRLWIAGVAPVPAKTGERVHSPLADDFAVLGIDPVPPDLQALPLAKGFKASAIPKLTPLITLGFPLGSQTQTTTVNVSVTSGHVRRTFETMIHVDTSIHPGNSGGPFIDARGRVVGMAATVALGWARGPLPMATPLSDIGLVLPITQAAIFLEEIKAGKVKWKGEIDMALETRLEGILSIARQRDWKKARDLADRELGATRTTPLVMAAAVMHLCTGDHEGARALLDQILSMDPDQNMARLMTLLTDWLADREMTAIHRKALTDLDWRSPDEFQGYLARILSGTVEIQEALTGGYTAEESSWLHLIAGLMEARNGEMGAAWLLLEKAALAADIDDWSLYLALSQLDRMQIRRIDLANDPGAQQNFQKQLKDFDVRLEQSIGAKASLRSRLQPIRRTLLRSRGDLKAQRAALQELRAIDQENSQISIAQAYYAAMDEDWHASLDYTRQYLSQPGRTNAGKLSLGLLEPEILHILGHTAQARDRLTAFGDQTTEPWYHILSRSLLDPGLRTEVIAKAEKSPENLLTGHTALGLWAEGNEDWPGAIRHYREALGSYADQRIEYDFALARVRRLRQAVE